MACILENEGYKPPLARKRAGLTEGVGKRRQETEKSLEVLGFSDYIPQLNRIATD